MANFSTRLALLREEKKMSQNEVAVFLGVSQSSIAYYESGQKNPSTENLIKLAQLFNCTTDYLLGEIDYPNASTVIEIPVYSLNTTEDIFAEKNITGWQVTPKDHKGRVGFFIDKDNCFDAKLAPGDVAIVERQSYANNRDLVVVKCTNRLKIRRVKFVKDGVLLYLLNTNIEPEYFNIADVEIVALVVAVSHGII